MILWLGLGSCLTQPTCRLAEENVLPLMLILSFPSGVLAVLVSVFFLGFNPPTDFLLIWLALAVAGYVQWFVLLPSMGKHREVISLNLSLNQSTPTLNAPATRTEPNKSQRREKPLAIQAKRFRSFDKQGRTPLDRALGSRTRLR